MGPFKNAQESHAHSLETLDVLYGYDSFLDSSGLNHFEKIY